MPDYSKDQQRVKEITDKLEQGLKELFDSEKYKEYLNTMSKFHNYSINNTLLIALQKPDATLVAGYQAWQRNFDRHVNKGEKGIRILAPAPYKIKEERDKHDPISGEMMFDENGMPEKEEVEVTIPAFRVVSVFDVSQTDGKPIPELSAPELLSPVDGYRDFMDALKSISTVPITFDDIPGSSHGYFSQEYKKIVVQEGMSESQILKTTIHEIAHSILHDRDINAALDIPTKDRNTREVESESIAYTVCQHFGIDTSEYSFSYVAGWSTDKEMQELKSSLDTIRQTASTLITGIERELKELQRERDMMQEQEKESLLLVQDSGLTEYSLLSVWGMEPAELMETLSEMNDDDRLSIAAYLESRGAWTTEIANQDTKEWQEYHLDVRYVTDRDEIIDLKAEKEMDERAEEPIGADDVILKITYSNGERFEVERITNKTPEEVQQILGAITKLPEKDRNSIHECLKAAGADFIPIIVSDGRNAGMPQFNDMEIDLDKKNVTMMHHLSPAKQAEGIINRLEYAQTAFSDEQKNLIVNHACKLNDMAKTRELAEHIYYEETEGNQGAALAMTDAQAEIDALPDPMIGLSEMEEYGYTWEEMLPLTQERALELFDQDLPVYLLHTDGSETIVEGREQLEFYEGICGIEKKDWENERSLREMQEELEESRANKEAQLLYGASDKYGIYQLKDDPELRDFHFAGTTELLKQNLLSDDFREIRPENYNLVYTGELSGIPGEEQGEKLGAIYEKFNLDHPEDFRGHSLSVSDIVVLHEDGQNSTHFVDSYGFRELPGFTKALEGVKEQPLKEEQETELAFRIADRYISIHETDGGYDYSIMDMNYREIDGGVYDNPDVSILQALEDIVDDLKTPRYNEQTDTFYHSKEQGNISANDELIPMDYEMMEEKKEAANRIQPSTVVSVFKEKTKELFHEIGDMTPEKIEETVKCHVQAKLDEYGMDAKIVDCAIIGTRCRGMEQGDSDLDVVVELNTNEREDVLFDTFNEDGLHIAGVKVDINPITEQRTGTLETYLPMAEEYLEEKRIEQQEMAVSTKEEPSGSLYANFKMAKAKENGHFYLVADIKYPSGDIEHQRPIAEFPNPKEAQAFCKKNHITPEDVTRNLSDIIHHKQEVPTEKEEKEHHPKGREVSINE